MANSIVKFTETIFSSRGKEGVLTPDSDGYFSVVVGALNSVNSAGEFYTAEGVIDLFKGSSQLMRRISNGALYSELGHPKRLPGMSLNDFYYRVISIEETNICGHFSEIKLDMDFGRSNPELNSPNLIAIIAKVKPAGPKADALKLALENRKQNTAFSIRGLTDNYSANGKTVRKLTNIITFDFVTEPGISIADKVYSPAVESFSSNAYTTSELTDTLVDKEVLRKVLEKGFETIGTEDSKDLFKDILSTIDKKQAKNLLSNW